MNIDPQIVAVILGGVAGLTVLGLTELLKRLLKATGIFSYIISLVVSAAATAFYLLRTGTFGIIPFILYTLFVFFSANGIYKAVAQTPKSL